MPYKKIDAQGKQLMATTYNIQYCHKGENWL